MADELTRGPNRLDLRFVQPSTRVYFDFGKDNDDEIDIFRDGHLSIALNLAEFYLAHYFMDRFSVGFALGGGIGSPAGDSEDGMVQASGAPVLLLSYGLRIELAFVSNEEVKKVLNLDSGILSSISFVLEVGGTSGFTAQEAVDDASDSALHVGIAVSVPIGAELFDWGKPRP